MSTVNSSCITAVFTESYCGSPLSCICFNAGGTKHNTRYSHSTEARTVLETDKSFFSVFLGKKKKKRGTLTNNLFTLDVYILFFLSPSVSNSEIITEKKIRFVWQLYHKGLHFISKVLCTGYSDLICSFLQQRCPFYCL